MREGWEVGDLLGVDVPLHLEALRAGGPQWLTRAFRASGALDDGNRVTAVTELTPFTGGSTGRKALLAVTYAKPGPPERLFVKLSRDLDDELRDRGRGQMESEVRFALLSQLPDFPVAVPRCLGADFHVASGSGVLISERIGFGADGVEAPHAKARDWEVPDLLEHYDALVTALARLAGAHRAGRFPADVMATFERPPRTGVRRRTPTTADDVRVRVERYATFARRCPQLLPEALRTEAFLAELSEQAPRSIDEGEALRAALTGGLTAFTHWNANIDNAWFWRDADGRLCCGLLDWGNVGQVDVVTALSSCLTFAEPDFVVEHLDHLLGRFATAFEQSGGGPLDPIWLRDRLALQMVSGGLRWPLDAVAQLERAVPDLDATTGRLDPRIADDEHPRTQLHLLTLYLTLWRVLDPRGTIDRAVAAVQ